MESNQQPEHQSIIVEKEHFQYQEHNVGSEAPFYNQPQPITDGVSIFHKATGKSRLKRNTRQTLTGLLTLMETALVSSTEATPFSASANTIETSPTIHTVGKRLVELVCDILHCIYAGLAIIESGTDILHFLAATAKQAGSEPGWNANIEGNSLAEWLQYPAASTYLRAGKVLQIDLRQPPFSKQTWSGASKIFAAPILLEKQLTGILFLGHKSAKREYTEEELTIIQAAVRFLALAIERERLQRARAEAQARELVMRIANQRMEEFLSIVGHEMRTPLTMIKTGIQLAQRQIATYLQALPLEDTAARDRLAEIQHILECAERPVNIQDRLMNDLLEISRLQADRLSFHPKPCNLAAILFEAIEDLLTTTTQRHIESNISPTDIIPVMADEARIRQVISNYLTNAHQYSPLDSPISVQLAIDGQHARIAVRDKGPGLTLEEQGRIWERFYRVEWIERQHSNGAGLGLGLYICQIIIEQHQGLVGVESTPGGGSTFWFTLPLAHQPQSAPDTV
ncbi:MAG TPA: GAF domain-containing sensor histidine kinase [Ktedonobacteraceae bacterium]|nr:GAF domain-containing sensor histidine kinase [Ktedonobacteraceae bacterium]